MSDVTAQQAGKQTPDTPPEQVPPQPITQETLDELRNKGDREGLDKAIEQMISPKPKADTVPPSPADQEIQVNKDLPAAEKGKEKVFTTVVRGQEVEYPDPDNYFGFENFGKLKKSFVHAKEETKYQQKQTREAREAATAALQEKETIAKQLTDTQARMKSLEDQIAKLSSVPPPSQAPATPPASSQPPPPPLAKVEKPVPPKPLNIPADPGSWTEDDVRRNEEYQREVSDYHQKSAAYMEYLTELATRKQEQPPPVVKTDIPPEYANQVKSLSEQLKTVNEKLAETEKLSAAEETKRQNDAYWESIDTFKDQHKEEFGGENSYELSSEQMSTKCFEWSDNLAVALGAKQPYTPYNSQDPAWVEYERQRLAAINDYLDENPETLKTVEGIESAQPPKGYRQYYGILKLQQARDKLINDGILGQKATLHDTWLKIKDTDGTFDTVFSKVQADAKADTTKQIFDHLHDQQADHATTIPNTLQVPVPDDQKISVAERNRILSLTTEQLRNSPEDAKKHKLLLTGELEVTA